MRKTYTGRIVSLLILVLFLSRHTIGHVVVLCIVTLSQVLDTGVEETGEERHISKRWRWREEERENGGIFATKKTHF